MKYLNKNIPYVRLNPYEGHACFPGVHVTKWRSDWPELFGMAKAKESAQRYVPHHPFCGHFVSGNSGMGMRLMEVNIVLKPTFRITKMVAGSRLDIRLIEIVAPC